MWTALAWGSFVLTLAIAILYVTVADGQRPAEDAQPVEGIQPSDAGFLVKLLIFAAIGALVAARRPHNPIGWLLCGVPVAFGLSFLGDPVYARAVLEGHDPTLAQRLFLWVVNWVWMFGFMPAFTLVTLWLRAPEGSR